ncbi:MAG: YiiX/YebB-like N1pC/P60 family cysteine hydrolase [Luteolibacter sp.]
MIPEMDLVGEIESGRRTLLAVVKVLPTSGELEREIADAMAAQERGYYLPDEDERLREVFASYLEVRTALRDVVGQMEPWVDDGEGLDADERLRVFIVGYCAACLLVRSGSYLIRIAEGRDVVAGKLDEAEPRYGIPRKSFTEIYRAQSSVQRMWKFYQAWLFYDEYRVRIQGMADDGQVGELVGILKGEEPFMEKRLREHVERRFRYRLHSFLRRNKSGYENTMFQILAVGGRTVSELRDPRKGLVAAPKRVLGRPLETIRGFLKPGDVLVTRHRDALTNFFLPGYWPHAALYVGERDGGNVVEAKKDGVLLRRLDDTLSVDAFLVLRAQVDDAVLDQVVSRALSHVGKLYDFSFDFRQAARMACTEVIYRSWHGQGGMEFSLTDTSGRLCLPAEALIDQTLASGVFRVAGYFGESCEEVSLGEQAAAKFKR